VARALGAGKGQLRLELVGLLALHLGLCLVEACGGLWRGLCCGLLLGSVERLLDFFGGKVAHAAHVALGGTLCHGAALCGLGECCALSRCGAFAHRGADALSHVAAHGGAWEASYGSADACADACAHCARPGALCGLYGGGAEAFEHESAAGADKRATE
jgi:hypothetical protein